MDCTVVATSALDLESIRAGCESLTMWARRRSMAAYFDATENQVLNCIRSVLPGTEALEFGEPSLAEITLSTEQEGWSLEHARHQRAVLTECGTQSLRGHLLVYATESTKAYDRRLRTDLEVLFGRRDKQMVSGEYTYFAGIRLGALSAAGNDLEYRVQLLDRSLRAMFPDREVRVVNTPEGAVLGTDEPYSVDVKGRDRRDALPLSMEICGFDSFEDASRPVLRWLEAIPKRIDASQLYLRLRPDDYSKHRDHLNRVATPWEFSTHCRLKRDAEPFMVQPGSVPSVATWLPLVQWWRRRKVEGMQLEYYFLLALVRSADALRLEVTSNCEDAKRVLRDAQEGTGLQFELIRAEEEQQLFRA